MNEELTDFLRRNRACSDGVARLESLGVETLADAWEKAEPADLIWAVTRPDVMDDEQRRQFLVFVLESVEGKLTDARSKNILDKLRTNSQITAADKWAAAATARAAQRAADESWVAAAVAEAAWDAAAAEAARAAAAAEAQASDAASAASLAAAEDAAAAALAALWTAAADAAEAAAREAQARWIRENFKLDDLHTK